MKRGRKPLPESQKAQFKSFAVDTEVVAIITAVADKLEPELGFRPTLSQTIRYLLKKVQP